MLLVPHESIDRADQQVKKLVFEAEIELLHGVEIQPAPERRDLSSDVIPPGRDRAPLEAVGGYGEHIALLLTGQEKKKHLVGPEELLDVLDLQRFRVRQRGIIGKFLLQSSCGGGQLALGVFDLPPNLVDLRGIR